MNDYYTNNRLQMNMKKTNVMIISNFKEDLNDSITINGSTIRNLDKIIILGIAINSKLEWNSHILEGRSSLLFQLKQRLNSIRLISRYISINFAKQLANALFISKVNFNIEVWGNTTNAIRKKLDKTMLDVAKLVLGKTVIGRTQEWIFKQLNWMNIKTKYENAVQNTVFKILNTDNDHFFNFYLTNHRNVRTLSENKVGHHDPSMGHSSQTQKSFLYQAMSIYNKLPRNLTLIKHHHLFKKWCKKFNLDNKIKMKIQQDNTRIKIQQVSDVRRILECQNEED